MTNSLAVKQTNLADYEPDDHNANVGAERGSYVIDDSLRKLGAGRSILVDKNGVMIAGNKTAERAASLGLTKTIEVETDGTELVVVRRRDLDLNDPQDRRARLLAYYDNRASELSLAWDDGQLIRDIESGLDLNDVWYPDELIEQIEASIAKLDEEEVEQIKRQVKERQITCPHCGKKITL